MTDYMTALKIPVPGGHQVNVDALPRGPEAVDVIVQTPLRRYIMAAGNYALQADRIDQLPPATD